MLHQTEGLVLRCQNYGESHKILTLITPQGKLSLMARGARKPKSRLAAVSQPLVQGMYVYFHRGVRGTMGTLNQGEVIHHFYRSFESSLIRQAYAMYFLECMDRLSEEESPSQGMYPFLLNTLKLLESGKDPQVLKIIFDLRVLAASGYRPVWERCQHCSREYGPFLVSVRYGGLLCADCRQQDGQAQAVSETVVKLLRLFQEIPLLRLGQVRLREETTDQLGRITQLFMEEYLDLPLKSAAFLAQVQEWEGV